MFCSSTSIGASSRYAPYVGFETGVGHAACEEPGVQTLRAAAAVLVVQELGQRRLGRPGEPRQYPGARVGLLEVVHRPHAQQVEDLLDRRLSTHVRRHRGALELLDHLEHRLSEVAVDGYTGEAGAQPALELGLEVGAYGQQARVPLGMVVGVVEAAVVQLVQGPQRQRGIGVVGRRDPSRVAGRVSYGARDGLAQLTARRRDQHWSTRWSGAVDVTPQTYPLWPRPSLPPNRWFSGRSHRSWVGILGFSVVSPASAPHATWSHASNPLRPSHRRSSRGPRRRRRDGPRCFPVGRGREHPVVHEAHRDRQLLRDEPRPGHDDQRRQVVSLPLQHRPDRPGRDRHRRQRAGSRASPTSGRATWTSCWSRRTARRSC